MRMQVVTIALAIALVATGVAAKDGFPKFKEEPINAPGSHVLIADPTGGAPTPQVDSFTLTPGACNSTSKYSNGSSDCAQQSIRSQVYEPKPHDRQPREAWYGWSLYLPADFPLRGEQTTGLYSFAYWHNGDCPHVAITNDPGRSKRLRLQTNKVPKDGSIDCLPDRMIEFANLDELRGAWHRFEAHIVWSAGKDGVADIFLDGQQVVTFRGRTLSAEKQAPNYFKYGLYLCCTPGTKLIAPATAYYAAISRADSREGLD